MSYFPSEGYPNISEDMQNNPFQTYGFVHNPISLNDPNYSFYYESSYPNNEDTSEIPDFSDACLKFINDILMEEDLDDRPARLQEYHALKATEKSLYDALAETSNHSSDQWLFTDCQSPENSDDQWGNNTYVATSGDNELLMEAYKFMAKSKVNNVNEGRERKNRQRENVGELEERTSKQLAACNEEYVEMEKFDDILICKEGNDDISPYTRKSAVSEVVESTKGSRNRRKGRVKKNANKEEIVDLRNLLIQCAQEVASFDVINANELLKQIRKHASEYGDSTQRVAYYFANGLKARLAGTGSDLYRNFAGKPVTSVEILKAYQLYVSAVPFQRTSYFLSNQAIEKLASKATKIHIIDFGIYFGFQWPGLIQLLSRRHIGPPRVRITGVDYPKSGFKPTQKTEETGERLAGYCERFGVPFEFQAIAQTWHTLKAEDFKIEKDEIVVVSCMYQSGKIPDEIVDTDSPRDCFLKMIRSLNPNLFIHGVVNGTFNAPFFITRFREALYHYSALFDVFEATMPREDQERLFIERFLYGKDAMNIVACEGSERIERPETYKQWQMRHHRVGFMQVGLDQEVICRAKAMVKANYNKDFMVEQDREWMVQGWKGRILSAVSCWKPT